MMEDKEMSDYIKKIADAMQAWKDCNKKRAFILMTMDENQASEDARNVRVIMSGSEFHIANLLLGTMNNNKDFRKALQLAAKIGMKIRKES